ncbi:MAG TPA: hypothetical protein PKE20_02645, partial [Promineifilum sp.]|nr:hypothetical protein [Promineifilum sp.]
PVTDASSATAPLFDVSPDGRDVFAAGLTTAAREALGKLPGAPVYHMAITIDESLTTITGQQVVTFTNTEATALDEVYFQLHPITLDGAIDVSAVTVDGAP